MDRVFYPADREAHLRTAMEEAGGEFAAKARAAVARLRAGPRPEDHKLSVSGGAALWSSDVGEH